MGHYCLVNGVCIIFTADDAAYFDEDGYLHTFKRGHPYYPTPLDQAIAHSSPGI